MEIDFCNPIKGLEDLLKSTLSRNAGIEDPSLSTIESLSLDNLEPEEVQELLKDLLDDLISFKNQHKNDDKAELILRNEKFDSLLRKLEAEVRGHVTAEYQLKLHIENYEKEIRELEQAGKTDKKKLRRLEGKFIGKKTLRCTEAEKVRKEMEEKILELTEIEKKKEKSLHKIEFENIKLRNLIGEKEKQCEGLKKDIIKLSKMTPRREQGSESSKKLQADGGKSGPFRDFSGGRNQLGKSMEEPLDNKPGPSPEKKITRSNTMDMGKKSAPRTSISSSKLLFQKFNANRN